MNRHSEVNSALSLCSVRKKSGGSEMSNPPNPTDTLRSKVHIPEMSEPIATRFYPLS